MPFRPSRSAVLAVAVLAAVLAVLWSRGGTAAAHPLGNFTINHYDRIEVADTGISVYRVLDMAEIPTFQERQKIDTNGDGNVDDAESEAWATAKVDELASNMSLVVNGRPSQLSDVSHNVTYPPGQGGLLLLRLTATYSAALPDNWRDSPPKIEFSDHNYDDRIGWREIIVRGAPGVVIAGSSVPTEDISNELLSYPQNAITSPLNVRTATFSFAPGAGSEPITSPDVKNVRATRGNPDSTLTQFANLVAKEHLSAGVIAIALLAATGFGALHALSPGHGKTIVGAYLVGSRGTAKHALLLGLTVTATHTSSVYALGFITLYLSEYIVPETLYPWLGVASGALIVVMGIALFIGRLRSSGLVPQARSWIAARFRATATAPSRQPAFAMAGGDSDMMLMWPSHAHGGDAHEHAPIAGEAIDHHHHGDAHDHDHGATDDLSDGAHSHGWGPAHSHAIPGQDGEPVTWQRLVGLGIFGGLLPCPSAIVVMLSAIALHRVGFGLLLIVFFSFGLAAVLTGIGFALVYARAITARVPLLQRIADRAGGDGIVSFTMRSVPTASAVAVVIAGVVVTLRATTQF